MCQGLQVFTVVALLLGVTPGQGGPMGTLGPLGCPSGTPGYIASEIAFKEYGVVT